MLKDDRDARTGRTDGLPVDQDLPGARCEQPTDAAEQGCLTAAGRTDDAENLIAFYIQFNVAKGDDCSFEEKLAGVINDDLGAVSHRKGVNASLVCGSRVYRDEPYQGIRKVSS